MCSWKRPFLFFHRSMVFQTLKHSNKALILSAGACIIILRVKKERRNQKVWRRASQSSGEYVEWDEYHRIFVQTFVAYRKKNTRYARQSMGTSFSVLVAIPKMLPTLISRKLNVECIMLLA